MILGHRFRLRLAGDSGEVPLKPAATIIVDGSSTVYRISKAAQEDFTGINPDVTVVVDNHGTGGGFSRYFKGEVDIVDASRPAKSDEEARRPRPRESSGHDSSSAMMG